MSKRWQCVGDDDILNVVAVANDAVVTVFEKRNVLAPHLRTYTHCFRTHTDTRNQSRGQKEGHEEGKKIQLVNTMSLVYQGWAFMMVAERAWEGECVRVRSASVTMSTDREIATKEHTINNNNTDILSGTYDGLFSSHRGFDFNHIHHDSRSSIYESQQLRGAVRHLSAPLTWLSNQPPTHTNTHHMNFAQRRTT